MQHHAAIINHAEMTRNKTDHKNTAIILPQIVYNYLNTPQAMLASNIGL